MNLDALADFRLVAQNGSFAKASRKTGRPKATLSRHVCELEESLGVRLFERDRHGLRLTMEGDLLSKRSLDIFTAVESMCEEVTQNSREPRGKMRVGAPVLFSETAMGWLTAKFLCEFPDIQLELTLLEHPVDITEAGLDLVIQTNPQPLSDMVGRCFLRDHVVIVAARSLHEQVAKLADEPFEIPVVVPSGTSVSSEWRVEIDGVARRAVPCPALHLPSRLMIRDAVLTGLGAAELPHSIVSADLNSGRLISWGKAEHVGVELWALHSSNRLVSRKVRAFMDFLQREFPGAQVDPENHDRYTPRSVVTTRVGRETRQEVA